MSGFTTVHWEPHVPCTSIYFQTVMISYLTQHGTWSHDTELNMLQNIERAQDVMGQTIETNSLRLLLQYVCSIIYVDYYKKTLWIIEND